MLGEEMSKGVVVYVIFFIILLLILIKMVVSNQKEHKELSGTINYEDLPTDINSITSILVFLTSLNIYVGGLVFVITTILSLSLYKGILIYTYKRGNVFKEKKSQEGIIVSEERVQRRIDRGKTIYYIVSYLTTLVLISLLIKNILNLV